MINRSGHDPVDQKNVPFLCIDDDSYRWRLVLAILLAGGFLTSIVLAGDANQTGAAPAIATPQTSDPVFSAFSSLHARQQWLEAEIARLQDKLADVASGFMAAQRALEEKEGLVLELQDQLIGLEQGRDQALSANLYLQAEKRELEGEIERQARTGGELTRRIESLEASLEQMQTEREVLKDEKDKLEEDLVQAVHRVEELSKELAYQQQHQKRLDELVESASQLEVQVAEQTEAANAARLTAEKAETKLLEVEASRVVLKQRSAELQASLATAEAELATLGAQRTAQLAAVEGAAVEEQHSTEEKAQLAAHLEVAREVAADAEQRLKVMEETHAGAVAAVERLQRDKKELVINLETEREKVVALQASLDRIDDRASKLDRQEEFAASAAAERERLVTREQELTDQLTQLKRERLEASQSAQAKLDAKDGEITDLKGQIGELQARLGSTQSELEAMRERVPVAAGGSLTDEQLRHEAFAKMQALRAHDKKRRETEKGQWQATRTALEQAVYDEQLLLAGSLSARGVHRVRRDDTLAGISREAYGKANRWKEIFEANRHLLDDPDRVFPGMTLIIP